MAMQLRLNLNVFIPKLMICPSLPVRIFPLYFLRTVLMPCRRNGWGKSASRGRQYPVSFLVSLRLFLAVMLLVYSELHWHRTAEVRVELSWS